MLPGGRGEEPDEEEKNWPGVGMGGGNRRVFAATTGPLEHSRWLGDGLPLVDGSPMDENLHSFAAIFCWVFIISLVLTGFHFILGSKLQWAFFPSSKE